MKYLTNFVKKFATKRNFSYLLINIGNIPIMAIVSSFLAVFFVNVLGMNEYDVGTMFLIARIFDGINDPIIGGIIDRIPGQKFSKFKRILVVGTIICSLNYVALWIGPELVCHNAMILVAYISYLLLGITFPIMDISLNSLLPTMVSDVEDREILSSIKVIGYGIGTVMVEIIVPIVLSLYGSSVNTYNMIIFSFVALVIIFSVGGVLGLKEISESYTMGSSTYSKKNGVKKFIQLLSEKNVLSTFLAGILFYTGNAVLTVSNTYYAAYYLGNVKYLAYVTVATYSLEMFVVIFVIPISKKYGERKIFTVGLLLAGISLMIRFVSWRNITVSFVFLMISSAIFGLGYGLVIILFYSIQAENVDRIYRNTGIEAEGSIAAIMSMINKFGKGIGGAVPLYVLGLMKTSDGGYTELSLRIIDGIIPGVLFILGALVFAIIQILEDKKYVEKNN